MFGQTDVWWMRVFGFCTFVVSDYKKSHFWTLRIQKLKWKWHEFRSKIQPIYHSERSKLGPKKHSGALCVSVCHIMFISAISSLPGKRLP